MTADNAVNFKVTAMPPKMNGIEGVMLSKSRLREFISVMG
jgi:hypothetical protein